MTGKTQGEIPARVGQYEVLERIGEGAMGEVFLVRRGPALAVLKRMHLTLNQNPVARARFLRETRIIPELNHPNIARQLEAEVEGLRPWVVIELVDGRDLNKVLAAALSTKRVVPVGAAVEIGLQILAGLEHAHEFHLASGEPADLVHRDLAPKNLMVSFDGDVKIIDFGVAHIRVDEFRTTPGTRIGTLRYMSPEQAIGSDVDARSDLYTVGVVLWELFAGEQLVRAREAVDALEAIAYAPPRALPPNVPAALVEVVMTALAKGRDRRFATARAFRQQLVEGSRGLSTSRTSISQLMFTLFPDGSRREAYDLYSAQTVAAEPAPAAISTVVQHPDTLIRPSSAVRPTPDRPSKRYWLAAAGIGALTVTSFHFGARYGAQQQLDSPLRADEAPATTPILETRRTETTPPGANAESPALPSTLPSEAPPADAPLPPKGTRTRKIESGPAETLAAKPTSRKANDDLRARFASQGDAADDEALLKLHDDIAARAIKINNADVRRVVRRELDTFQRGGESKALLRAIEALGEN